MSFPTSSLLRATRGGHAATLPRLVLRILDLEKPERLRRPKKQVN